MTIVARVVVTGASGKTGGAIHEGLRDTYGHDVFGVDRNSGTDSMCDISDAEAFTNLIRHNAFGARAIIHAALDTTIEYDQSGRTDPKTQEMWRNVMRAAIETDIDRIILCSSTHTDGRYKQPDCPPVLTPILGEGHPTGMYAENKLRMEREAATFAEETGAKVIIPRLGGFRVDDSISTPASWLSRRDMVNGLERCLTADVEPGSAQVFYLLSENGPFDLTNGVGYMPQDSAHDR